jgi:hypothetical protein
VRSAGDMAEEHVVWEVMEEHLGGAGYLWTRWRDERVAPDITLPQLAAREARLLAHVDALVIGGAPVQEQLLLPALEQDDAERCFAAASALLWSEAGDPSLVVLERLVAAPPGAVDGIAGALELAAPRRLEARLRAIQEMDHRLRIQASARRRLPRPERGLSRRRAGPCRLWPHPQGVGAATRAGRHP